MSLLSDQGLKMVVLALSLLGIVAMPVWAEEKQDVMSKKDRAARIHELQRDRARGENELRQLRAQQGSNGRDVPFSIRGSK
jgi:hypothetical protein